MVVKEPEFTEAIEAADTDQQLQIPNELPVLSSVQRELKGGETQSFRVHLNAGQYLYAVVEQQGIDVRVSLFKPDGSLIAASDSPNDRFGTEPALLVADVPGEYRIEVRAAKGLHDKLELWLDGRRLVQPGVGRRQRQLAHARDGSKPGLRPTLGRP